MTLEKAGCREDCFHCPYPDCVVDKFPRNREQVREGWRRANKNRYERLKAKGICCVCQKMPAAPGMTRCETCRELSNEKRRRKYGQTEKGNL